MPGTVDAARRRSMGAENPPGYDTRKIGDPGDQCLSSGLLASAPDYVPVYYFQFFTAPLSDNLRATILPGGEGCWDTGLIMTSFRMDAEGRLIIGAMGDLGQAGRSVHATWCRRKLAELFPQLADQPLTEGWHGRIAMTSDHIPKITQIGPNALSAHGYSGRGIGPGTVLAA